MLTMIERFLKKNFYYFLIWRQLPFKHYILICQNSRLFIRKMMIQFRLDVDNDNNLYAKNYHFQYILINNCIDIFDRMSNSFSSKIFNFFIKFNWSFIIVDRRNNYFSQFFKININWQNWRFELIKWDICSIIKHLSLFTIWKFHL